MSPCEEHSGLLNDVRHLQEEDKEIWTAIDGLRTEDKNIWKVLNYRLPLWATFLIAGQSAVIGYLMKG